MMDRLRDELRSVPFNSWLGLIAISADADAGISIALPFRRDLSYSETEQVFHGGVVASMIDAAGYAAVAIHRDIPTPTVNLDVDFVAPAASEELVAHARVRRSGRLLSRVDVEVFAQARMVAMGRGIFLTREAKK